MNGTTSLYSIGGLSALTGVPVRTIRFYSDSGLLPPTDRTPAGYRSYDEAALTRLRTICALRELDVGLATISRVLGGALSVAEVAAVQADATELQIRVLRLRHSVLRHLARRRCTPEETLLVHDLTRLTSDERRRLVTDFITGLTATTQIAVTAAAALRTAVPDLPEDPSDAQLAAWVELAELMGDTDFRARVARATLPPADEDALPGIDPQTAADLVRFARQAVTPAIEAQTDPHGEQAAAAVEAVVARFATALERPAGPELRAWMARQFAQGHDPLVERYWRLVWTVNDWHVVPGHLPFQPWLVAALRGRRTDDQPIR
ncbi:MerR family transcriptional regulator [Streptomyces platensis]|uniref:MerR family transcriptional regulator n=1 Tax=Streptomyces platensis TaxID=58346 RepID=UPI001F289076|nr:MerR family transcriptional regulator [Streptomyces platensis]MCF3141697.1 MerR family transcriptional regulator [Streptomyces platensis]